MNNIIDFAEIEEVKENVQPLRSGRNPKDLAKQVKGLKAQPLSNTVSIFEEASKEWEEKLAEYGGEDPLEVWDEYIKWSQQNATSDKLAEQVIGLLQRCTRKFQATEQYKDDPRYLRIWIKYIDTVTDPADIFEFLEANRIGTNLALFYTSWALVLELKKSMYAEAYQKLDQGLQRKAHPVEKVQNALKDFQHRMNQRTIETMKNVALESKPAEESQRGREFGDQLTKKRQVARPAAAVSSASSVVGTTARRGLGGSAAPRSAQVQGSGNKAGFAIFCDDGAADAGAAAPGGFANLPSEKEKSKENTRGASKWTKDEAGTIPQRRPPRPAALASAPAAAKAGVDFELFVDEELAAKEDSSPHQKNPVRLQLEGLAGRQRDTHATDRQKNPLEYLAQAEQTAEPAAEQGFQGPLPKTKAPVGGGVSKGARANAVAAKGLVSWKKVDPRNRNKSEDGTGVAAYDRSMLRTGDGEEICPEEARMLARYGLAAFEGTLDFAAADTEDDVDMEEEEDMEFKMSSTAFSPDKTEHIDIPNETQPSPTFSNFAPKNSRKTPGGFGAVQFSAQTPLLHQLVLEDEESDSNAKINESTDKQSGTMELKVGAATPYYPRDRAESLDHVPPTLTKFGGDISIISRAANSTFFANSSRTTLCPSGDPNFSLQETEKVGDENENCAPAQLSFTNGAAGSENRAGVRSPEAAAADFFSQANEQVSPTINSKMAHKSVLDLMPSPTQTVNLVAAASVVAQTSHSSTPRASGKRGVLQVHSDDAPSGSNAENKAPANKAPAPKKKLGSTNNFSLNAPEEQSFRSPGAREEDEGFFKRIATSPTVMTKHAAERALHLMPSPTQTCMPTQHDKPSPTLMTKNAALQAFDLMPSPTQTAMPVLEHIQNACVAAAEPPSPPPQALHTQQQKIIIFDENSEHKTGEAHNTTAPSAKKPRGLSVQSTPSAAANAARAEPQDQNVAAAVSSTKVAAQSPQVCCMHRTLRV